MLRNLSILSLLLAGIALYTFADGISSVPEEAAGMPTKPAIIEASDFAFTTLDGKSYRLADFRGKAVILNFWASWCAPCVIEMPHMLRLAQTTKNEAVFMFLSLDKDEADVRKFLKRLDAEIQSKKILIALDKNGEVSKSLFQTYKIPETYLIDAEGKIRKKIVGADIDWNSPEMIKTIADYSR